MKTRIVVAMSVILFALTVQGSDDVKLFINGVQVYPAVSAVAPPQTAPSPAPAPNMASVPSGTLRMDSTTKIGYSFKGGPEKSLAAGETVYFLADPAAVTSGSIKSLSAGVLGYNQPIFIAWKLIDAQGKVVYEQPEILYSQTGGISCLDKSAYAKRKGAVDDLISKRLLIQVTNRDEGGRAHPVAVYWTFQK